MPDKCAVHGSSHTQTLHDLLLAGKIPAMKYHYVPFYHKKIQ